MFVFVIAKVAAAVLLVDGMEDMEELANAGRFVGSRARIKFCKGGFDETRFGREISGEADGAHASTINWEIVIGSEIVDRGFGGEMLIIA